MVEKLERVLSDMENQAVVDLSKSQLEGIYDLLKNLIYVLRDRGFKEAVLYEKLGKVYLMCDGWFYVEGFGDAEGFDDKILNRVITSTVSNILKRIPFPVKKVYFPIREFVKGDIRKSPDEKGSVEFQID